MGRGSASRPEGHGTKEIVIVDDQDVTGLEGTVVDYPVDLGEYIEGNIILDVSGTFAGTSPTIDADIEMMESGGGLKVNHTSFTQVTADAREHKAITNFGKHCNIEVTYGAGAITAGVLRIVAIMKS